MGKVKLDATYLVGKVNNIYNAKSKEHEERGKDGKQAVMGMRECQRKVKAAPVASEDKETIQGAVKAHIQPGSSVYTDEHRGYKVIGGMCYDHQTVNHSAKEFVNGVAQTNRIEFVWAVMKRGFHGVYHHWSVKHRAQYIS